MSTPDIDPKLLEHPPMYVFYQGGLLQHGQDEVGRPTMRFVRPVRGKAPHEWESPPTGFMQREEAEFWASAIRRMLPVLEASTVHVMFYNA